MGEIKTKDIQEVRTPVEGGFREIKPTTDLDPNQARNILDDMMGLPDSGSHDEADKPEDTEVNESKTEKIENDNPRNIITRNEALENDKHPGTGVPFERRVVELPNGEKIEGVFPTFDSLFDVKIEESLYLDSNLNQNKECNTQLYDAIEADPSLREKFTDEQIEQIKEGREDGTAPDGYVWHHDAEAGKMQLVNFEVHEKTGHTGGRSLWGGGYAN